MQSLSVFNASLRMSSIEAVWNLYNLVFSDFPIRVLSYVLQSEELGVETSDDIPYGLLEDILLMEEASDILRRRRWTNIS